MKRFGGNDFGSAECGRSARGFTLLELMVVVAVIAILAAIAFPAYTKQVRKGHRADAFNSISDIQLRQERWRADHSAYPAGLSSLGVASTSASGYYTVSLVTPTGPCATVGGTTPVAGSSNSYAITATATGVQAQDTRCATIVLTSLCSVITKSSTGGGTCWPQ